MCIYRNINEGVETAMKSHWNLWSWSVGQSSHGSVLFFGLIVNIITKRNVFLARAWRSYWLQLDKKKKSLIMKWDYEKAEITHDSWANHCWRWILTAS